MTNPVKFPNTERIAPEEIHIWPYPATRDKQEWDFEYDPQASEKSLRYLREDVVIQMMAEAMQLWAQHERRDNAGTDYDEETRTVHDQISELIGEVFVNFLEDE